MYAPMYEVPANIAVASQSNPVSISSLGGGLFVSTIHPQLSETDPRANAAIQGLVTGMFNPPSWPVAPLLIALDIPVRRNSRRSIRSRTRYRGTKRSRRQP